MPVSHVCPCTQVDDDIKYGMIEAISHLIHRDYEVGAWGRLCSSTLACCAACLLCFLPPCALGLLTATPCPPSALALKAIVEDFVTLQFIAPGTDLKPILPALANVRMIVSVAFFASSWLVCSQHRPQPHPARAGQRALDCGPCAEGC